MKKTTRLFTLAIATLFCASAFLMPAAAKPQAQATTELLMPMIGTAAELPGWTASVEAANALLAPKNIHIKIQAINVADWTTYYQKITAMMAAGQDIDLGRIAESQMPVVIANDQAVDLTDHLKNDFDISKYFEGTFKNAAYQNGHYFGIPSGVYFMTLYYNKDMFDKAGIVYPSTDWNNAISLDQVAATAKKLTQGDPPNKTFGFSAGPYMAFIGMYSVSAGGVNVFHSDGTCAVTDPASVNSYKWFAGMLNTDKTMPRPTDLKILGPTDLFKAGKLAMMVDGTWDQPIIKQIKSFKVGIAAVPSANGKAYSSQFVDSWVMWKGTKHEAEAWEAMKALTSPEAAKALAAKGVGGITIRRDVLDQAQNDLIGDQFSDKDKTAFTQALDHTLAVPYNQFYNEIDVKVNANLDSFLLGQTTAEDFAKKVCTIMVQTAGSNVIGVVNPAATASATMASTMTVTMAATPAATAVK